MTAAGIVVRPDYKRRLRWLSLTPFDQSTAEGRGDERHRRVVLTAASSALAKLLSVSTALISIPLTLHYLGAERFGMWMTISSLIAMLSFADFGIANGVLSGVASAHGRDDRRDIREIVASGFFLLSAIAVVLALSFGAAYAFLPWPRVFNVQSATAAAEAGPSIAVFVLCFAAAIPLGLVQRVQMGLQLGFTASLWQCAGTLLALIGVLLAIRLEAGLPWLVLAMAGAPLAAALLNSLYFYLRTAPDLRPRWSAATRDASRQVAGSGMLFFVLQVTVAVAYASDSFVIAQLKGAAAVAGYAVTEKMFGLVTLMLAMVLAPLWPAYGEAIARGDHGWVRRTLRRSLLLAFSISGAATLLLIVAGPALLRLWTNDSVVSPLLLLLALALWKTIESTGGALAVFLNGMHVVRLQVLCAIPTAIAALGLKFWLVPQVGISGVVWASIAAFLVCTALPTGLLLPSMLRDVQRARG